MWIYEFDKIARGNPRAIVQDRRDIQLIRNRPNVVVAIGNRIVTNSFDRWLAELSQIDPDVHVYWIHTKYMLVDPLGPAPTVVTGSANFSKASTDTNDENMVVISGNRALATNPSGAAGCHRSSWTCPRCLPSCQPTPVTRCSAPPGSRRLASLVSALQKLKQETTHTRARRGELSWR